MARRPGSGLKSGFVGSKLVDRVTKLVDQKHNSTVRELAAKFAVRKSWIQKVLATKRGYFESRRAPTVPISKLPVLKLAQEDCTILSSWSKTMCHQQLPSRVYYWAFRRFHLVRNYKYQSLTKYLIKFMIWQAICSFGWKSKSYIAKCTKKGQVCIQECLKKQLLPFSQSHDVPPLLWPGQASVHYTKRVLNWYKSNKVHFMPTDSNLPNCSKLRPIESWNSSSWTFFFCLLRCGVKNTTSVSLVIKKALSGIV